MNKQKCFLLLSLILIMTPFLLGTTYVIKEDGKEVGRYEEPDGQMGEKEIVTQKPKVESIDEPLPNGVLNARVSFYGQDIYITNSDDFDWTNCNLAVNLDKNGDGYFWERISFRAAAPNKRQVMMGKVYNPGEQTSFSAGQFTKPDGTRLDVRAVKPISITIACSEGSWSGDFD